MVRLIFTHILLPNSTSHSNLFNALFHYDLMTNGWTPQLNHLLNDIKASSSKNAELVIPNTSQPLYTTGDPSSIGLSIIKIQANSNNKMQVICYNSQSLETQDKNYHHMIENSLSLSLLLLLFFLHTNS